MPSTDPDPPLHVVAGVIRNKDGKILLSRRQQGRHQAGKWEFPGGKCERGETPGDALARELGEELGIRAGRMVPRIQVPHRYPDVHVLLEVFDVIDFTGEPVGLEGQAIAWVPVDELDDFDYPAANLPVISSLRLPEWYAISDITHVGEQRFMQLLEQQLQSGLRLLQLREPGMTAGRFASLAGKVASLVHQYNARLLLNTSDEKLVASSGADGMHLRSSQLARFEQRPLPPPGLVAASCHTAAELQQAQDLGADFAVLSPVKTTSSHPQASPIGWDVFATLAGKCGIPVYALGGMQLADIETARHHGGQGVAVLSGAWK